MPTIDFDSECWDDPWMQSLPPLAKLLFVYLWTNSHRNPSGMYTITRETISFETKLKTEEIDGLWPALDPKVKYDPEHSVCWVVKHTRRQFLRSGKISEKQRQGVRRQALRFHWHPFFLAFARSYPEIFTSQEISDFCSKRLNTHSMGIDTLSMGQGGGGGGGSLFKEIKPS